MRYLNLLLIIILIQSSLFAQLTSAQDVSAKRLKPQIPEAYANLKLVWQIKDLIEPWISQDDNGDGRPDSARVIRSNNYTKIQEVIDSNNDGFIDDFAFFDKEGRMIFQEIDSNFDQKLDLWVEIDKGERIIRIQRDLDYDGFIDRDYDFSASTPR